MKTTLLPILFAVAFLFFFQFPVKAQEEGKTDSVQIYQKIESISEQRHITRLIYPVFFKVPSTNSGVTSGADPEFPFHFSECEGKIIRSVQIQVFDPFTYQTLDSVFESHSWFARAGNIAHIRTLPLAIRNHLIIKSNENFDSLRVMESVRLVRKQSFVRQVNLKTSVVNDSVDICFFIQDVWSIVPDGSLSAGRLSVSLREQNFLGTGYQVKAGQNSNLSSGRSWYLFNFNIPNFENSFIKAQLNYQQEENGGITRSVLVDRPFYSNYTRWAGGLSLEEIRRHDSLHPGPELFLPQYIYTIQDYWLGTAWPLFKGNTEVERMSNLMVTNRWYKVNYNGIPHNAIDTSGLVTDEVLYLLGVGFNSRKYIQDHFLFKYGVTEDIPIGRSYFLLGGIREKQGHSAWYLGLKGQWADMYRFGYMGVKAEWGTFLSNNYKREASGLIGLSYFTSLMQSGRWKFRQFVKSEFAVGSNLLPSVRISFDPYMGTSGFDNVYQLIRTKGILSIQTQAYAPWNILGFRFGPFLQSSIGFLSEKEFNFSQARFFTHLGLGVLIRNDYLNASFLQLSFSYYPYIPEAGKNVFRTNTFTPRDFGLMDFESGKPEVISLH